MKYFLFPSGRFGQNVIIVVVDMSSSVHVDNNKKDILLFGEGSTEGLDDATLVAKKHVQLISLWLERNYV